MATLALKPVFPIRTRSSGSRRDHRRRRVRDAWLAGSWQTIAIAAGAVALTFFCVSAPMIGDRAGRLFALDTTPTIPMDGAARYDAWSAYAFEFTPTTQGPAITAEVLALAELTVAEEDGSVVMMPELEVHASPPAMDDETMPPG